MNVNELIEREGIQALVDGANVFSLSPNGRVSVVANMLAPVIEITAEQCEEFKIVLEELAAESSSPGHSALLQTIAFLEFYMDCCLNDRCICGDPLCKAGKGSDSTARTH